MTSEEGPSKMTATADSPSSHDPSPKEKPTVVLTIGMAGSGKTTFMQRLTADLHASNTPPYVINLDPAVLELPYPVNVDIRDTVNYKEVMRQYHLGPNGGILTALNLFTTKFDQILDLLEKRLSHSSDDGPSNDREERNEPNVDKEQQEMNNNEATAKALPNKERVQHSDRYTLIDTPGQIEIFTWSASGAIITEALAANYRTVIAYVVDAPRCMRPATFMSNMLYACSIMYKTRLPMVVVLNKTDIEPADTLLDWMQDVLTFQEAIQAGDGSDGRSASYMDSLVQSMSLVLEEFYRSLRVVPLSAWTGEGMDEFWKRLQEAVAEYDQEYRVEFERRLAERKNVVLHQKEANLATLLKDLRVSERGSEEEGGKEEEEEEEVERAWRGVSEEETE